MRFHSKAETSRRSLLGRLAIGSAMLVIPAWSSLAMTGLSSQKTVFWEGRGKNRALFHLDGDVFWQGRSLTKALANIRGRVAWRGRGVLSAILSVDDRGVAWLGTGRSRALFSKDENGVFWEGTGRSKALANLDGRTIWEGRGRQRALANWEGDRFSDPALFTTIWFLLDPSRLAGD